MTSSEGQPNCRHCGSPLTHSLVDLGDLPLANAFVAPDRADVACETYPLHVRVCGQCLLVQIEEVVPPKVIFSDTYAYFSSYSDSWLAHCARYAIDVIDRFALGPDDLILEIASNDGYLLKNFVQRGIPVLGIEPAQNVARVARAQGVETRVEFFTENLAVKLRNEGFKPALICSANVLAHVPDINDFVRGLAILLQGDAVYSVEFPHLLNLIQQVQFDTIYHEHYCYLSLFSVEKVFAAAGLRVFDVQAIPTHGGSLRVFACRNDAAHLEQGGVAKTRTQEQVAGLTELSGYTGFDSRVRKVCDGVLSFLNEVKAQGKSVAAYGAAAKGNTLLTSCGIGRDLIEYCVDKNPEKQGKLLPGSHIPVYSPDHLRHNTPDYVLILPWNLADEIVAQLGDLALRGVKFVTPLPQLKVLN